MQVRTFYWDIFFLILFCHAITNDLSLCLLFSRVIFILYIYLGFGLSQDINAVAAFKGILQVLTFSMLFILNMLHEIFFVLLLLFS